MSMAIPSDITRDDFTLQDTDDPSENISNMKLIRPGNFVIGVYHTDKTEKFSESMYNIHKFKPEYNYVELDADSDPVLKALFYRPFTFIYFPECTCGDCSGRSPYKWFWSPDGSCDCIGDLFNL